MLPYRDATWCQSPYDLTLLSCWQGLRRAIQAQLYSPDTFDEDEYFYYDHPENGDMHEVVTGKFFAFKGPTDNKQSYYTRRPSDYMDVFRVKGIKAVVRLNKNEYAAATFTDAGIAHHDLFFTDCSTPSDAIADKVLRISERTDGPLAVHCIAGLGRTGTLIGLYLMKHLGFSADECMAWLRIVRPGSVIGPQQQYLKDQEKRINALGKTGAVGMGLDSGTDPSALDSACNSDAAAADLAEQITRGMEVRDKDKRSRLQPQSAFHADKLRQTTPLRLLPGRQRRLPANATRLPLTASILPLPTAIMSPWCMAPAPCNWFHGPPSLPRVLETRRRGWMT